MQKNILVLPDGTEITSGVGTVNAIQSTKLTQSVNSGEELTLGSACAAMLEMTLFTPGGELKIAAGEQVTLYQEKKDGQREKLGVFLLEQPTRPSANTLRLTGYDPVIRLEQDLTQWLEDLEDWPCSLLDFAGMVCNACGLTLSTTEILNGDLPVVPFSYPDVTGRRLMQWIGEVCGCFCRANAEGEIALDWYTDSGKSIGPQDYFGKGLQYEAYRVAPIEGVQIKLTDDQNGALWPQAEEGANTYVISGNPILLGQLTPELLPYLEALQQRLEALQYTPCTVSLPADPTIQAGDSLRITDRNGKTITALVMSKVSTGQRDTLECTGSYSRDSVTANATKPNKDSEKINQLLLAVKAIDSNKVVSLINLSENGVQIKGSKIALEGVVTANDNFKILANGSAEMKNASLSGKITANDGKIAGWTIDDNSIRAGSLGAAGSMWLCRNGTGTSASVGSSGSKSGWCIAVGDKFGVDKNGAAYASDIHIHGGSVKIASTSGYSIMDAFGVGAAQPGYPSSGHGVFLHPSGLIYETDKDAISGDTVQSTIIQLTESGESLKKLLAGNWYIGGFASSVQVTSDRNAKFDIQDQPEIYSALFDKLRPVTFRYKDGTSGRIHTGLIAQDVEGAVLSLGMDTKNFAGVCYDQDEDGTKYNYGIRYEELVSMLIQEVQKLKHRVKELESKEEQV